MKTLILILLIALPLTVKSQWICYVNSPNEADLQVYITSYVQNADVSVFLAPYRQNVNNERGIWFVTGCDQYRVVKMYITPYVGNADLVVFFVLQPEQAGWKNKSKMNLLKKTWI